jgi:hypothetical protein
MDEPVSDLGAALDTLHLSYRLGHSPFREHVPIPASTPSDKALQPAALSATTRGHRSTPFLPTKNGVEGSCPGMGLGGVGYGGGKCQPAYAERLHEGYVGIKNINILTNRILPSKPTHSPFSRCGLMRPEATVLRNQQFPTVPAAANMVDRCPGLGGRLLSKQNADLRPVCGRHGLGSPLWTDQVGSIIGNHMTISVCGQQHG